MIKIKAVPASLAALVCVGCVWSINPLYTPEVAIRDRSIVGEWKELDPVFDSIACLWTIRSGKGDSYELVATDGGENVAFAAHLIRIGTSTYLDLYPQNVEIIPNRHSANLLKLHQFWRIELGENVLTVFSLNLTALDAQLKEDSLPYSLVDGRTVLTLPTSELQQFIRTHGERLFPHPSRVLRRRTS